MNMFNLQLKMRKNGKRDSIRRKNNLITKKKAFSDYESYYSRDRRLNLYVGETRLAVNKGTIKSLQLCGMMVVKKVSLDEVIKLREKLDKEAKSAITT